VHLVVHDVLAVVRVVQAQDMPQFLHQDLGPVPLRDRWVRIHRDTSDTRESGTIDPPGGRHSLVGETAPGPFHPDVRSPANRHDFERVAQADGAPRLVPGGHGVGDDAGLCAIAIVDAQGQPLASEVAGPA